MPAAAARAAAAAAEAEASRAEGEKRARLAAAASDAYERQRREFPGRPLGSALGEGSAAEQPSNRSNGGDGGGKGGNGGNGGVSAPSSPAKGLAGAHGWVLSGVPSLLSPWQSAPQQAPPHADPLHSDPLHALEVGRGFAQGLAGRLGAAAEDAGQAASPAADGPGRKGAGSGGGGGVASSAAAAAAAAAATEEEAEAPLKREEVQRLARFVYEASIPLERRFYCCNSEKCNRLFDLDFDAAELPFRTKEECRVVCPFCSAESCARCKILFHGALECEEVASMEAEKRDGGGSEVSLRLIQATSKPCPSCRIQISHYHGHACHHIAPGTGCVNCGYHFCFSCLRKAGPILGPMEKPCGCAPFCENDDILAHVKHSPVAHDDRCGCVFCPDCRCEVISTKAGAAVVEPRPCANCDGTCVVCVGVVVPGSVSVHKSGRMMAAL